jgi:selenocysteine-specific elongation factor
LEHIVIATAGHVDHGKTTLIRALTGIETDTTKEEKRRGLTINLGFAYFDLPSHQRVGIVDVPGHEKFLKNMIAGLSGIDLVLLVVDAGEGVMPQTREHAAILRLLGITNFIVVLTKVDTVDPEMCDLAVEDIKETFKDTVIATAPIVKTDAVSGTGLPELVQLMDQTVAKLPQRHNTGRPRLNVDRVFSLKGFGTVVTGTLLDGAIRTNDDLEVYPNGVLAHVRNIQVHDQDETIALPGQRTALNLNIKADQISRGDVLTLPDNVQPSWMLDLELQTLDLPEAALTMQERVRLYIGAREVLGRVYPLGTDELKPHDKALVQIRLEEQVGVKNGDRFIMRTYSPMLTIGGGQVLSANPKRHHRYDQPILETLHIRQTGDAAAILTDYIVKQTAYFVTVTQVMDLLNVSEAEATALLAEQVTQGELVQFGKTYAVQTKLVNLKQQLTKLLSDFHQHNPLVVGLPRAEFMSRLADWTQSQTVAPIFDYFVSQHVIKEQSGLVALADFEPQFTPAQQAIKQALLAQLAQANLIPSAIADLVGTDRQKRQVLNGLINTDVVLLNSDYVMATTSYQHTIERVTQFIQREGALSLADFRDITGSSRRYAMMILERMDKDGVTQRVANKRELKG